MPTDITLLLRGDLVSKKNRIRTARGKGGHYDRKTADTIQNLILQARTQWGARCEVGRFTNITLKLWLHNWRKDRDGILTTLLDVLKQARVIHDDSCLRLNGWIYVAPAEACELRDERVEITLTIP
jgi:Holliday junction resolvase RusA-like endonuclease